MVTAGPYWVTAHPVSWLPYELPAGDDRQISSEDRRSVKLRVRPPLPGTHRCHGATPPGRGDHAHSQVEVDCPNLMPNMPGLRWDSRPRSWGVGQLSFRQLDDTAISRRSPGMGSS